MMDLHDQASAWLERTSELLPVDVMPGDLEMSNTFLPQKPLSKCLFPSLVDPASQNQV